MFPLREEEPLRGVAGRPAPGEGETAPGETQTRQVGGQTSKARKGTTAASVPVPWGHPGRPGTFHRRGSSAAATGKLTFLFEALSPSRLMKSSRGPGRVPVERCGGGGVPASRAGARPVGTSLGRLAPPPPPPRPPPGRRAAAAEPGRGGVRRRGAAEGPRAAAARLPAARLRSAGRLHAPTQLCPPLCHRLSGFGHSPRGHGKTTVNRSFCSLGLGEGVERA